MKIAGRQIGNGAAPFVIAEMSGNHNQSLERALAIVEAAAAAGAHAIKLQTYTADTMTLNLSEKEFRVEGGLWDGQTLYKLYQEAQTPWEWHAPIFGRAKQLGMIAFSSPFDESAVAFLEELGAPCYKIASFENTDLPLVRRVAATGKPMIISTGMASAEELDETVAAARAAGAKDLVLLKCTSTYPASPADTNILTIPDMRRRYGCEVGLSDHTAGIGVAVAAVGLGACVVEKHFTLRRADGGVDSAFSLEPAELKSLVQETERAWQALGAVRYGATESEKKSLVFRRSLYVVQDLKAGELLTRDNVRAIRPGLGLPPKHLDSVLGKPIKRDTKRGTPLTQDLL
jgi:N-acetylneuraminate synthase